VLAYEQLMEEFRGVHAINVTPFREDRTINYDHLGKNIDFLIDNGLRVVVSCGNTGEFYQVVCVHERPVYVQEHCLYQSHPPRWSRLTLTSPEKSYRGRRRPLGWILALSF